MTKQYSIYPLTEVVVLAGGQARRMSGVNKLLQTFDEQIQLVKIYAYLSPLTVKFWVNSDRDLTVYRQLVPNISCFSDEINGFLGPLMGMKTAWSYAESNYILFIPCDITYIPSDVFISLHERLKQSEFAEVVYVELNSDPLYPFCLMKRSSLAVVSEQLVLGEYSLKECFKRLNAEKVTFQHERTIFHSINSIDELQQYRKVRYLSEVLHHI
ncbi:hypothetical protein P256_00269 [Acinetobacter nectaris CIP 110549]|uniref:MobA-like NTP transferase domain-containing protein n=1 Tax=Acinetobacter nectaris CIP 110549 TaxID=1392540 RepID=V2V1A0_9GAMM|nr:NTP transferase domain-containing protein [Acinetobacter nectaris]ESK41279.1 hypothetical protein P256_00269 [Acinetobacter nectaris CIP 110549]